MKYVAMTLALILIIMGSVAFGAYHADAVLKIIDPQAAKTKSATEKEDAAKKEAAAKKDAAADKKSAAEHNLTDEKESVPAKSTAEQSPDKPSSEQKNPAASDSNAAAANKNPAGDKQPAADQKAPTAAAGAQKTTEPAPQPAVPTAKLSAPKEFKYSRQEENGIQLTLIMTNKTGKIIDEYTIKLRTWNAAGNPAVDKTTGSNTFELGFVGPIQPNAAIDIYRIFTHNANLRTIEITEIDVTYNDGTSETLYYPYKTSDSSGL